jgi:glycosyltransferase
MSDAPVISIITPSLNSAGVLADCIESVRGQGVHCEHILVDGASTDDTLAIAQRYGGHFSQVISEPDGGIYAAMNKGIRLATGTVIGILNADDSYASFDTLATIAGVFQDSELEACYGDLEFVDALNPERVVRRWQAGAFGREKFFNGWMPPHPTLFFRRGVYERYGLYREDLGTAADYEFMLRVFVKSGLVADYVSKVLVRMRTGGASNHSLAARWRANRNDALAWRVNGLRARPWTVLAKPLRKLGQWWV